jgi:chromosome segregation ATPase
MAKERTVKEILASIDTTLTYQENHLQNIDKHLERLNTRTGKSEVTIATNCEQIDSLKARLKVVDENGTKTAQKNANSIIWMRIIGGALFACIIAGIAFIGHLLGAKW